jgi:hypothetical protein
VCTYPAIASGGIGLDVSVAVVVPHHRRPPAAAPPGTRHDRSIGRRKQKGGTS